MSVLALVLTLVVLGVLAWVINTYLPMAAGIKQVVNLVLILVAVLIVLQAFGVLDALRGLNVPSVR